MPPPVQRKPLGNARKVQGFVAAHVVAVTLIYGMALWLGGGLAEAPLPPAASRPTVPQTRTQAVAAPASTFVAPVAVPDVEPDVEPDAVLNTAAPLPTPPTTTLAQDTPAPWDIDRHGTVHWRQP